MAVLFGASGPYRAAAQALTTELRAEGHECALIELPAGDQAARQRALKQLTDFEPTVVASGGASATIRALEAVPKVPVVFFMVPNVRDAPFMGDDFPGRGRVAGVASDIDPAEQVNWIARTHPRAKKIAVLHSPHSEQTAAALEKAGRKRGLVVTPLRASRDEFPKAIEALNKSGCDGALMIPDAQVYNSPNVQRLLLWGVRHKKPVWTFSPKVVKAGAFSGLSCDSAAVGRQAAQIVKEVAGGKAPAAVGLQYPQSVGRAVNVHTAETIGAALDNKVFASDVARLGDRR